VRGHEAIAKSFIKLSWLSRRVPQGDSWSLRLINADMRAAGMITRAFIQPADKS